MKTLIRIVVALVVLVAAAAGAAYLLPGSYRVERSIEINAPASVIFARVGDLRQWATWTPWYELDPAMKTTFSEASKGVGAWEKWDGEEAGKGEMTITVSEPPARLVYDLYFPDFDMRSVGEIALVPAESGSGVRVTWSDSGKLGMNPINRWFGLAFDKMIGGDFEKGLQKLKKLSETPSLK